MGLNPNGAPFGPTQGRRRAPLQQIRDLFALRLAGGSGNGINVDTPAAAIEADMALGQRVQAPVASGADVVAGNEFRAALANEDAARRDEFPTKSFHAESFADAIASVA